jgi:hypothetical protein
MMGLDQGLLAALEDMWHSEKYNLTSTLHDVSYLLKLPIAGEAIGTVDIPDTLPILLMPWYLQNMLSFVLYQIRSGSQELIL